MGKHGSKRQASKHVPRRAWVQAVDEDDVETEHREARIPFSADRACAYDATPNVVGTNKLHQYMARFELDRDLIRSEPAGNRAVWNPPPGMVAIYGAMLSCGVTLPLQPFIALFLAKAKVALA